MKRRLEALLAETQPLRSLRAIQVLEHIGSTQAREVLHALARGWPTAPQTCEAEAALMRLSRR